jgi:hypothetical protein
MQKKYAQNVLGFMELLEDAGYLVTSRVGTRKQIMARLNIPKDAQIRGLRKAIKNRKTPRQFIPGMKKRLAKLTK